MKTSIPKKPNPKRTHKSYTRRTRKTMQVSAFFNSKSQDFGQMQPGHNMRPITRARDIQIIPARIVMKKIKGKMVPIHRKERRILHTVRKGNYDTSLLYNENGVKK